MIEPLKRLIQEIVNSQAKLEIMHYFQHNPYAWESLSGLAQRLHRTPEEIYSALLELTRHHLVRARPLRAGASELVYSYNHEAAARLGIPSLVEAYDGEGRQEILDTLKLVDEQMRWRRWTEQRALESLRRRFVSMITHELRTPLTIIKGTLETLQQSTHLPEDLRPLVQRAERQSERLSSVVENLLVLAGLETGRDLELYLGEIDFPRLLQEVCRRLQAGEPPPNFRLSLQDAPETIIADEYLLGQLLEELLHNAIKFSPPGAPIGLEASQDEENVFLCIEDQGQGIAPHDYERVFAPFEQGAPDSSYQTGGMGLGLFMARKIVEAHGGAIWIEAKPPPGTRLCLRLPLAGPPKNSSVNKD